MEKQKRVGIWVRVSDERQVEDESPQTHEYRARLYAQSKEWEVVEVYLLEAKSGKSVVDYPETKQMLRDIKSGHISVLIFSKLARLARNTKELLEFADIFKESNADLVSLFEAIDTSTPVGRFFYTIIAALAQWEREEIVSRVNASIPIRAKLGKPLGGAASYGYRWENKQLVIDEKEAPIRKLMYELFLQLRRKKATANELNRLGYRTRNGAKFTTTTVTRLLHDSTAKGQRVANYSKSYGEGKGWKVKPKEEWTLVPCPAIVSEELWNECNQLLVQNEKKRTSLGKTVTYLLSGFVFCSCGIKMYINHTNGMYRCRSCKAKISAADLDEIYHSQLKHFLIPGNESSYIQQYETILDEKRALFAASKKRQDELRKLSQKWLNLRITDEITPQTFAKEHKPIEQQLEQLKEQIAVLESDIDILSVQSISTSVVFQEAKDLYDQWEELPFEKKRAIVEVITERITVGNGEIAISLAYVPSFSQNDGNRSQNHRDSY